MPKGIGYGVVRNRKRPIEKIDKPRAKPPLEKIDKPRAKPPLEKIHKGKKPKRTRSYK